ncbi:hypothetical protein FVE85_1177 [Porphyridium purpureum]|uniref:Pentatricopeptide repeat-containing protein n=1 Tax=Porphyridium purpureum TaxID=35688 RepID=A0A5J4Z288_PORPP|nr:hypothetical protein FVE85_1177 [Porphyridium purpureum]|eukprot:POR1006..scf208_2
MLGKSRTPFDAVTLEASLDLARRAPDLTPRAKLAFVVRMVQQARKHRVQLDSRVLMQCLILAKPCRKVNVVVATSRVMLQQQKQALQKLRDHLNESAPAGANMHNASVELLAGRDVLDAVVFDALLRFFLRHQQTAVAAELWSELWIPGLAASNTAQLDASILESGAWVCAKTGNATEAARVAELYQKLGIKPDARVLHLLVSACVRAAQFGIAREYMQWICSLGYTLHECELRQYVRAGLSANKADEPLDELLLTLADEVLTDRDVVLCSDERNRVRFLRFFFNTLHTCVSDGRLPVHIKRPLFAPRDAFQCAQYLFARWKTTDSGISSCMVYLASRAGCLSMAMRVALASHEQAPPLHGNASKIPHGMLHAFAYEALVEQCLKQDRMGLALDLIFDQEDENLLNARRTAHMMTPYLKTLGRLGRLDLCHKLFRTYEQWCDILVRPAGVYMKLLSKAGYHAKALTLFRKLHAIYGSSDLKATRRLFRVLSSVVLQASSRTRYGGSQLSVDVIEDMVRVMKKYVRQLDRSPTEACENPGEVSPKKCRSRLRDLNREQRAAMQRKRSKGMIQKNLARIDARLKWRDWKDRLATGKM